MVFFYLWGAAAFVAQVAFGIALVAHYLFNRKDIAKTCLKVGIICVVLCILGLAFFIYAMGGM